MWEQARVPGEYPHRHREEPGTLMLWGKNIHLPSSSWKSEKDILVFKKSSSNLMTLFVSLIQTTQLTLKGITAENQMATFIPIKCWTIPSTVHLQNQQRKPVALWHCWLLTKLLHGSLQPACEHTAWVTPPSTLHPLLILHIIWRSSTLYLKRLKDRESPIQGSTTYHLSKQEDANIYSYCRWLMWSCHSLISMLSNTAITVYTGIWQAEGHLQNGVRVCVCGEHKINWM